MLEEEGSEGDEAGARRTSRDVIPRIGVGLDWIGGKVGEFGKEE